MRNYFALLVRGGWHQDELQQYHLSDTGVLLDNSDLVPFSFLIFQEFPYSDGAPHTFGNGKSISLDKRLENIDSLAAKID